MPKKPIFLLKDTYLAMIKNSVEARIFRHAYFKVRPSSAKASEGKIKKVEVLRDGDLSCAFFVSIILVIFKLIKEIHTTVDGVIKDMQKFGWRKIKKPKIGSILIWQSKVGESGEPHRHIGFYIGNKEAVSNSDKAKSPQIHNWQFDGKRKVESIYWHEKLG